MWVAVISVLMIIQQIKDIYWRMSCHMLNCNALYTLYFTYNLTEKREGKYVWNKRIDRTLELTSDAATNVGKHFASNVQVRVVDSYEVRSFHTTCWIKFQVFRQMGCPYVNRLKLTWTSNGNSCSSWFSEKTPFLPGHQTGTRVAPGSPRRLPSYLDIKRELVQP